MLKKKPFHCGTASRDYKCSLASVKSRTRFSIKYMDVLLIETNLYHVSRLFDKHIAVANLTKTLILVPTGRSATARRRNDAAPVSARDRDVRGLSNRPDATVYNGPKSKEDGPKRVTLRTIRDKYRCRLPHIAPAPLSNHPSPRPGSSSPHHRNGVPLTMVTAYDYPSAVHVDNAGIDLILVGDSVGMVVHGHDTTQPVTMDDMVLHCRAVTRGVSRPFVIGDLPFGSYELGPRQAVRSAMRLVKEAQVDAVKLEGGGPRRVEAVAAIVEAGVAVMGHVGLNPQAISVLGGFRAMGRTAEEAARVVEEAQALEKAGCFAVVLECVPAVVGRLVTESLSVPTIGIGAGPSTSGQVLVYHDLLGMMQHPHHAKVRAHGPG